MVSVPRARLWDVEGEEMGILIQAAPDKGTRWPKFGADPCYQQASLIFLFFLGPGCLRSEHLICSAALGGEVCCLVVLEFIKVKKRSHLTRHSLWSGTIPPSEAVCAWELRKCGEQGSWAEGDEEERRPI